MKTLTDILKPEHKAMGLCLEEDDHLVYLKDKDGEMLAYWPTSRVTETEILIEADNHLWWEKRRHSLEVG